MPRIAVVLVVLLASAWMSACETCPFQNTGRLTRQGTLDAGAVAIHDVAVPNESDLEIDLLNVTTGGQADAWLTAADCAGLFDGPYPSTAAPMCPVLFGPVTSGSVTSRRKAEPGTYRIFVYAWDSNTEPAQYAVGIGTWWHSCVPTIR